MLDAVDQDAPTLVAIESDSAVRTIDHLAINHLPGSSFRYTSLDAIRGVASVAVILFHTTWPNHLGRTLFVQNIYTAVDLFFLLSGFVMAASYAGRLSDWRDAARFVERRLFRLYPLHWAVLAFLVAVEGAKLIRPTGGAAPFTGTTSPLMLVANILFVQGMGAVPTTNWNPPSWSVSAELLAYLVFGAAGLAGLLRRSGPVAAAALAGCGADLVLALSQGTLNLTSDCGIVRCLAGFPIGVAVWHFLANGRCKPLARLSPRASTGAELLAVAATLTVLALAQGAWIVLVLPCFAALIALLQQERGQVSRALTARPLRWLGTVSYSVYLVHVPIRNLIIGFGAGVLPSIRIAGRLALDIDPWTGDALIVAWIAVVLVVAAGTFRFVEEPARLFGRRISAG